MHKLPLALIAVSFLAACDSSASKAGQPATAEPEAPAASQTPASPAPAALPSIDVQNAQTFVQGDNTLVPLTFERTGSISVKGKVAGYTGPVYAVPVAAGQTLSATFTPGNTNLYFNISDATDHSGTALHRGEVDGAQASLKADHDTTFVITVFQPRAMARRGETGDFDLSVSRD